MSGRSGNRAGDGPSVVRDRYCPRCGRTGQADDRLCAECGESLIDQGYCAICEQSWRLPVGAHCPKHEVELEPRPDADHPPSKPILWVTVATFADALQAEPPRIRLEAEGIATFLEGERMGSRSMYQVATGGVRLQVPEELASDARILLSQSWTPPVTEDDLDDAWDELAPEPGTVRRSVMKGVIVFFLLAPLFFSLLSYLARHFLAE